ncbi:MAG: substrate-binding domain-containing protein [Paracoccaceae bacterium]
MSDGSNSRGLQILLGTTDYDMTEEEQPDRTVRRRPEAILVTGGNHTPRARRMLENAGIPVIETWDLPENPIDHVIGFSNAAAVRGMVDHLVARGLTRIAVIGGDTSRDTRGADRRAGFVAAMQAHGLDASRLIAAGPPPISMREGAEAMARLLDALPDTEAVICVSDLSAFGALTECQRRGVPVPGRVSIAGFGDYEIAGICVPPLTTINPHPRDIGSRAVALIGDLLDGRQTGPARVIIQPDLILRPSSL